MRVWLSMIAIASACADTPSVIEVHAPGAASIEVMIASYCYTKDGWPCSPGIAWDPMLPAQPPADVFTADRDDRLQYAVPPSGVVTVQLRPPSLKSSVDRLVFLAFDANDGPIAFAYLRDVQFTTNEVWIVDLDPNHAPISEIGNTLDGIMTGQPGSVREHVWRPPELDKTSCVARQVWRSDVNLWDREVYVAPSDFDCDGYHNDVDCDPSWYLYGQSATIPAGQCALATSTEQPNACTVGALSPACVDDGTNTPQCHQTTTTQCVPDAMCKECPIFAPGCGEAAAVTTAPAGRMPYVTCDIAFDTDPNSLGQPCTSQNNDTMSIDLSVLNCAQLLVYPRQWPPTQGTAFPGIVKAGMAYLTESAQGCTLDLKFDNGTAPVAATNQPFILGIETTTGPELDIPLLIHFEPGCGSTTKCTEKLDYDPARPSENDGVFSCLGP